MDFHRNQHFHQNQHLGQIEHLVRLHCFPSLLHSNLVNLVKPGKYPGLLVFKCFEHSETYIPVFVWCWNARFRALRARCARAMAPSAP